MVVENLGRQFSFPPGIIKIGEKMWFAAIFEVLIASTSRLFYTDTLWWCENREKLEIRVSVSNIWHVARTKHAFKRHTDTQDSENRENLLGTLSVFPSTPSARVKRVVNKRGILTACSNHTGVGAARKILVVLADFHTHNPHPNRKYAFYCRNYAEICSSITAILLRLMLSVAISCFKRITRHTHIKG